MFFFALLAGLTQGKRNYSALLGAELFSLDGYKVRNVWTQLVRGACVLCVSSGQLHAPVKTGIWRVLFHLATCHQLKHNVPRRPFCSPSRSRTHKQTGKHKLARARPRTQNARINSHSMHSGVRCQEASLRPFGRTHLAFVNIKVDSSHFSINTYLHISATCCTALRVWFKPECLLFFFFFPLPHNKESFCPDLSFFHPGWEERSAMCLTLRCSVNATTCTRVTIFKSTKNTVCVAAGVHQIINLLINLFILAAAAASNRWLMGLD